MVGQVLLLLAEDEPVIRLALEECLEEGGYRVLTAASGADALAIIEQRWSELSGLVTDIRLGSGPDGWQLAHRARELNPALSVVYITGDSAAQWPANGVPNSFVLQKPFADSQLLTAVSTLLNQAATSQLNQPPSQC